MLFTLKKAIAYLLMPVPVVLIMFAAGLLLVRTRRRRLGRALVLTAIAILFLLSNNFVSTWLVRPLETRYAAIPDLAVRGPLPHGLGACRYVVVLGSGNGWLPGVGAFDDLTPSARARIATAVRILRLLPEADLLVSGPKDDGPLTHATVLERAAVSLGVDPARIQRVEHALDTEDESLAVKRRVGSLPFVLVTSAWHMPRAMALFRSAGLDPLPCPTDFTSHSDGRIRWRDLLFDVESLERSTTAIHERLGLLWITLRGKNQRGRHPVRRIDPASRRAVTASGRVRPEPRFTPS